MRLHSISFHFLVSNIERKRNHLNRNSREPGVDDVGGGGGAKLHPHSPKSEAKTLDAGGTPLAAFPNRSLRVYNHGVVIGLAVVSGQSDFYPFCVLISVASCGVLFAPRLSKRLGGFRLGRLGFSVFGSEELWGK